MHQGTSDSEVTPSDASATPPAAQVPPPPPPYMRRSNSSDEDDCSDTTRSCTSSSSLDVEEGRKALLQHPPPTSFEVTSSSSADSKSGSYYGNDKKKRKAAKIVKEQAVAVCDNLKRNGTRKQALKLCFGSAGIYGCYLVYGHLQEDVFRYRAADGTKFTQVWFLQVLECACNVAVGIAGRHVFGGRTPTWQTRLHFFQSGASQVFSKVLTSLSLAAGLSFPVCTLSKSAKMVPVMLGQLVLGGSSYTMKDYLFAAAVVVGTAMLSMGKDSSKSSADGVPEHSSPTGIAFIVLSLVMDGITGGLQKRLKKESEGKPPTTYDFLLFTNLAMGFVAFTIAFAIGDFTGGVLFLAQNPLLQQMIVMTCLLSAMGQSFIFYVVANFDPMVCATVTTTRKILSVLWSIAVKGHAVSHQGHVGLVVAIGGILLGLQEKLTKKMSKRLRKQPLHRDERMSNIVDVDNGTPPVKVKEIGFC